MNTGFVRIAESFLRPVPQFVKSHPKHVVAVVSALLLTGTGATFAVANLAPEPLLSPLVSVVESVQPLPMVSPAALTEIQDMRLYRSDVTRSTDTAEVLLKRLGIFDPDAASFLRADSLVQKLLLGRVGRNVTAETHSGQRLLTLTARWSPEDDGMFKRLTVEKLSTGYQSRVETLHMTASTRLVSGSIQSSLFAATDDAGLPDAIAIQLAEIFSGEIDFHRALRKGDYFSVAYEALEGDGEPLRAGRVLSAEFVNAGKAHQAMWFQEPAANSTNTALPTATHALTKGGYYTLAGESLRRAYLASPMQFSRVSSGFKMRLHPILKTWRAHLGVDYAAPTGTPVRSVGDGMVEFAGVQNGFGNVVIVRHRNNHTTVYAHLSRIGVRQGQNVSQGQNVGSVGSTGWATGPHLHFEFRVNGVHRDPLTIARQSESVPVSAFAKPMFDQAALLVRAQLAAAAQMQFASAQ